MTKDRIKEDTIALASPTGRRVGQPGHDKAIQFLKRRMRDEGLLPFRGSEYDLTYSGSFTNLVGVLKGTDETLAPLLIGAHYDSAIDAPCADDNAASVALLLKIARTFKDKPLKRKLIIAFFDAEERPYFATEKMGSTRFCEDHCHEIDLACVIILDAIGHDVSTGKKTLDFFYSRVKQFLFIQGTESHRELPKLIYSIGTSSSEIKIMTLLNRYTGDHSDYLTFRKQNYPYLFLCKGSGHNTHTKGDTIDWINFEHLNQIYDLVAETILRLDNLELNKADKKIDPFLYDVSSMKRAIGSFFPIALFLLTRKVNLRTRKDVDYLADKLLLFYRKHILKSKQ